MSDNTEVDIQALAKLARMEVSSEELSKLEKEIPDILAFVKTIQSAAGEVTVGPSAHRNVMRPDESPHKSGEYTERLLAEVPEREGDLVAVKQVISREKRK